MASNDSWRVDKKDVNELPRKDPSIGNSLMTGFYDVSIQENGDQHSRRVLLVGNIKSRQMASASTTHINREDRVAISTTMPQGYGAGSTICAVMIVEPTWVTWRKMALQMGALEISAPQKMIFLVLWLSTWKVNVIVLGARRDQKKETTGMSIRSQAQDSQV
jgi:hypothetical protein